MTIEQGLSPGPCHLRAAFNPLSIAGALPDSVVGDSVEYIYTVASINAPTTCIIASGSLPTGLSMDAAGKISGEVTVRGDYTWTVRVIDASGYAVIHDDACIVATLMISGHLPNSYVGDVVNYSYTVSGGVLPVTFAVSNGTLPTGLTMDGAGVVTGTTTTLGNFSWTVSATDVDGNPALLNDSTSVLTAVTWDSAQKSAYLTLSNSNLTATNNRGVTSGDTAAGATLGRDAATANHYFEVLLDLISGNRGFDFIGIAAAGSQVLTNGSFGPGRTSDSWGYRANAGYKMTNNSGVAYGAEYFTGDVVGVLIKAGKLYFRLNGTWIGDPVAETGYAFSGLTGTMYPAASSTYQDDVFTGRFRSSDLTGLLPTGTVPWGGL